MRHAIIYSLVFAFLLVQATRAVSQPNAAPKRPNIILLLADDLGYADLSVHGSRVFETPHLDQLAQRSVQFANFYVNPVCAPSRAALLTGRHFLRTGVSHVHGGKDYIHLGETLLPEALKANGYVTGMWGKWHSGMATAYFPWERGFDEAFAANLYQHQNPKGLLNGQPVERQGWADSLIVEDAIRFIEQHRQTGRPYFAFLPFLAPHTPIKAPDADIAYFQQKGLSENFAALAGMIYHLDRRNWQQAGDFATYQIHVDEAGAYEVRIPQALFLKGQQARLAVRVAGQAPKLFTATEQGFTAPIYLEKGPQSLTIELLSVASPTLPESVSAFSVVAIRPITDTR